MLSGKMVPYVQALSKVLSITCAGAPSQKWF